MPRPLQALQDAVEERIMCMEKHFEFFAGEIESLQEDGGSRRAPLRSSSGGAGRIQ